MTGAKVQATERGKGETRDIKSPTGATEEILELNR